MKAVIFAGGTGTRLWPLSRKRSPKQFERIIGDKSTLQLAVERLLPDFKPNDIYIATQKKYQSIVEKQMPNIPKKNIIIEPEKKDVGPAVALVMGYLTKKSPDTPTVILWSDHLVKNTELFRKIIKIAGDFINQEKNKIIFIGQQPRFASENLGWIQYGKKIHEKSAITLLEFIGFKYRPNKSLAQKYFSDKQFCWNLGYFVSTPSFIYDQFKKRAPKIYENTELILDHIDKPTFKTALQKYYHLMPVINFDNAIIEKLSHEQAYVINEDIGWSDLGAWEGLKDALSDKPEDNIMKGKVILKDCVDNVVYNFDKNKTIVGIDLDKFLVINTKDVLLVAKKTSVSKIKKLVESMENTEKDHLI